MMLLSIGFIFAVLIWSTPALAWGPGTHLEIALHCLDNIAIATPAIAALLKKYPHDFIYGSVSPDIFLSKMRAGYMYHCHNWRMGHLLLTEARTNRLKAAAYGLSLIHI